MSATPTPNIGPTETARRLLFPNVPEDGYRGAHLALETLGLLDTFRDLNITEIDRVITFVEDARHRMENPDAARAYRVLETFGAFAECYRSGEARERTMQDMELTPGQYDRLERAWQAVQAVYEEVQAACFERDGAEPNTTR